MAKKRKSKKNNNKLLNSNLQFHGAWINPDWQSSGNASILFARKLPSGLLSFVHFGILVSVSKCDDSFLVSRITEEKFRNEFLADRKLLKIDESAVKDILRGVVRANKEDGYEVPKEFYNAVKLVGNIDWKVEKKKEEFTGSVLRYAMVKDRDDVEVEVRQTSVFRESDESTDGAREFLWIEARKKGVFAKKKLKTVGRVKFTDDELIIEVSEDEDKEFLDHKIFQYLGACIE
ncbi:hypothetical protein [Candidatus Uabimicrobium sp. HlEnr_7]|uniref:hypothetical protein n=1 Tax=Candidatus Uabimicrobium helgolandensis TaxID=3095367 RepID=UPI003558DF75